jgi:coatomer protein complex subunit alpha (xenin)
MQAKKAIHTAAQYILAMSIELQRRALTGNAADISSLSDDDKKRALELSAYFTIPELEGPHKSLPLSAAMNFAHKNKQLNTALNFANTLLDRTGNAKMKESAKRVKTIAERNPSDAVEIDFDQFADFEICAASYTPIYGGSPSVACPFDGAKYHGKYKGTVCKICEVCQIGAPASGLRLVG